MKARQLKVVHIVQNYYPYDIRVRKFTELLARNGHSVSVICIGRPDEPCCEEINGISVYRIPLAKKRGKRLRYYYEYLTFFIRSFFLLNKLDNKAGFNVVHIHTMPDILVFIAWVQKIKGTRILLDHHEPMPELYRSKYGTGPGHPMVGLLKWLEKISMNFADRVITVNNELKQLVKIRSAPKARIEVIMNTVDQNVVTVNAKTPHTGFNCVYHGTIFPRHGLGTVLEAVAAIREEIPGIGFHIFGEGSGLDQLQEQCARLGIGEQTVFNGVLPYPDLIKRLSAMDLGIIPLRSDPYWNLAFPNKLGEYVFLKIPVVISELRAVRDCFNEDDVLYFKSGDPRSLAQKIRFAYKQENALQEMTESALRKYREIDWTVMSRRYLKLLEGL